MVKIKLAYKSIKINAGKKALIETMEYFLFNKP